MVPQHRLLLTASLSAAIGLLGMSVSGPLFAIEGASQIAGTITKLEGDRLTVHGSLGQDVTLRVTKNTNVICLSGKESQMSTGREAAKEHEEIPPTPHMEKQAQHGKASGAS
jgi:hypothetical protein